MSIGTLIFRGRIFSDPFPGVVNTSEDPRRSPVDVDTGEKLGKLPPHWIGNKRERTATPVCPHLSCQFDHCYEFLLGEGRSRIDDIDDLAIVYKSRLLDLAPEVDELGEAHISRCSADDQPVGMVDGELDWHAARVCSVTPRSDKQVGAPFSGIVTGTAAWMWSELAAWRQS